MLFTRVWLCPLCCQIFFHHGMSMFFLRFTFFTQNFLFCCDQITKIFRSGHDCTSTSSAWTPCCFLVHADITIWVLRKMRIYTVLTRTRFHFHSRLHWKLIWKCLDFRALGFPKTLLLKCFHRPNSLCNPEANQAIHAVHLFVLLRVPHFVLDFSVYLLTSNTKSCGEDDGEVRLGVVEEELADKSGTTNGTSFDIFQTILFPFLMKCGFWPLVTWHKNPWSSQSFPKERTAGVSSCWKTLTIHPIVWQMLSLLLLFAPRRQVVITVVGLFVLMVSN